MPKSQAAAQVELAKKAAAALKVASSSSRISRPPEETPRAPRRQSSDFGAPERLRDADPICGPPDELVPDPKVFQEFNISPMTGWRWDRDPELAGLGWPPPIQIRRRNFRSRQAIDAFKARLIERALEERVSADSST